MQKFEKKKICTIFKNMNKCETLDDVMFEKNVNIKIKNIESFNFF